MKYMQTLRFTQSVSVQPSVTNLKVQAYGRQNTLTLKSEGRTQPGMKALSFDTSVPTPTMNLDSENGCYRLSAVTMFKMPDPSPA